MLYILLPFFFLVINRQRVRTYPSWKVLNKRFPATGMMCSLFAEQVNILYSRYQLKVFVFYGYFLNSTSNSKFKLWKSFRCLTTLHSNFYSVHFIAKYTIFIAKQIIIQLRERWKLGFVTLNGNLALTWNPPTHFSLTARANLLF